MIALLAAAAVSAPLTLPHQARLLDAAGQPVEGTHSVSIQLLDAADGGSLVWSRSYPNLTVADGYVSVMLDGGTPSLDTDLFDGSDVWLLMAVDDQPILPRTPVGSVLHAAHASSVTGPVRATEVRIGDTLVIDSEGHVYGRGPTDLVCDADESPVHDGSAWSCAANHRTDAEVRAAVQGTDIHAGIGLSIQGQSIADSQNVRAIVTKATANGYCSAGTAVHVPWSYRGLTGSQICAADARNRTSCTAVHYIYITNNNSYGSYPTNDPGCGAPLAFPWPWGNTYDRPNTLDGEWGHGDTYVVCCQ